LVALTTRTLTLEAPGFQHAQQLHLPRQRQRSDLVEEQRPAVGGLELAFARLARAGVRARVRAEQLGFDQFARQRAAVHRDEGTVPHRRVGVQDLGDFLLAGPVRTGDEYRQVGARDLAGERKHAFAGCIGEHGATQVVVAQQRVAPAAFAGAHLREFASGFRQFEQVVDGGQQLAVVPRLGEIVGGAGLDQVDRAFQVRPRRQQDDRQVGKARADVGEQRNAFLARGGVGLEVHVLHDEVDRLALQQRERLVWELHRARVDVVQREQRLERGGNGRVVVDDEDGGHGQVGAAAERAGPPGRPTPL